jgi:hypothetical protein
LYLDVDQRVNRRFEERVHRLCLVLSCTKPRITVPCEIETGVPPVIR